MRIDKLTTKFQEALADAQSLALGKDHAYIDPSHVLMAMLQQQDGPKALLQRAGVNLNLMSAAVNSAVNRLPQVTGQDQVQVGPDLVKLLQAAEKESIKRGDSFIASELFLLALTDSKSELARAVKDAGLSRKSLETAVDAVRGGQNVNSAEAEGQRESLKKYCLDLTERARMGKLDPVIGRDDDLSAGIPWSTASVCGSAQNASCFSSYLTTSGEALNFLAIGTGRAATAAIVARHASVSKGSYAAGVADEYATTTASDWWLPSRDELNELCKYARDTNQVVGSPERCEGGTIRSGFPGGMTIYWSSSEAGNDFVWAHAFNYQPDYAPTLNLSHQSGFYKTSSSSYVRPVRGF